MAMIVVIAAALSGGCARTESEPRYLYPPQAPCPAVNPHVVVPAAAPLNADFRPVTAAICTFEALALANRGGLDGGWAWRSVQRTDGPLDALLTALRTPPPRHRGGEPACPESAQAPMSLALTDASGQVVIPAIPADPCGFRLTEIDQAINALTWVTIDSR
jgi:hypothetical protein